MVEQVGVFPDSAQRAIKAEDLQDKSAESIGIARNEIYARHGKEFQNPTYSEYFKNQDWYRPNPNFKESELNPMEKRNVAFLHVVELDYDLNNQRSPYKPQADVQENLPGLVIPDVSTRQLETEEVKSMSPEQLRTAQNDVYAEHGYPFQKQDTVNHYSQLGWYQANPNYSDKDLSWMEERNLEMMHMVELDRKLGQQ